MDQADHREEVTFTETQEPNTQSIEAQIIPDKAGELSYESRLYGDYSQESNLGEPRNHHASESAFFENGSHTASRGEHTFRIFFPWFIRRGSGLQRNVFLGVFRAREKGLLDRFP